METQQESTPVLRYFDIMGKAEAIRLLFEDNGITYSEVRISSEWYVKRKTCEN